MYILIGHRLNSSWTSSLDDMNLINPLTNGKFLFVAMFCPNLFLLRFKFLFGNFDSKKSTFYY
jgi:hypothetical protein